ncbi:SDR family NAD(P)-dependent oxidoreductase [Paractinoplanes ferrugineus]|uniref:Short-chain dehydrogenase n=1 Tax=Paractinoplanes ferrugineus TaxID=113564 RepID=A0A919MDE1_9ACTN|nr:SDR family NAD(P)-dependent oxidoreductase [Actinoplanes ferrugineus]GIE10489.1 short-chain dehydrogenase [Actinoplanes ferrugineus]
MARVLITGSGQGLGFLAGQLLAQQGHRVVLHARNERRAAQTCAALPTAEDVLVGDLSSIAGMRSVAEQANASGRFDAVVHNAGVGFAERRITTEDGLSHVFAINVLAPYVLTALITPPDRLVYLSSGMHERGSADLSDPQWRRRWFWRGRKAYADSKLFDVLLAFGVARAWPRVRSNALEPGWVPTRMGGRGATDDLRQGYLTQAWLAVSDDPATDVTGEYFFHQRLREPAPAARDTEAQEALLDYCAQLSRTPLPAIV